MSNISNNAKIVHIFFENLPRILVDLIKKQLITTNELVSPIFVNMLFRVEERITVSSCLAFVYHLGRVLETSGLLLD